MIVTLIKKNTLLICVFFNILLFCTLYFKFLVSLFPLSLFLAILPGFLFIFRKKQLNKSNLFMLLLPLLITRYILPIRFGLPSGYDDIQWHIIWAENSIVNGKIIFSELDIASNNFIGLYLYYNIVKLFTNIDIPFLAILIHPFINIISFIIFYFFASMFLKTKSVLLALILFAWEPVIFDFGEFRTQSFALVYFLMLFYFILKNKKSENLTNIIIILLLLINIVITSYVTFFISFICLLTIFLSDLFFKIVQRDKRNELLYIDREYLIIFSFLFIIYITYIGNSFNNLIPSIIILIKMTFLLAYSKINVISTIFVSSGIIEFYIQWIMKFIIFMFTILVFFYQIIFKKPIILTLISLTMGFCTFLGLIGAFELSSNRFYYFFIIFSSITTIQGYNLIIKYMPKNYKNKIKFLFFIIIFTFSLYSIIRLPNYIIGNTYPFRTSSTIDEMKFYDVSSKDVSIGKYLYKYGNFKYIYFYNVIMIYCYHPPYTNINPIDDYNIANIIYLHDSYNGNRDYYGRDQFPTVKDLSDLNLVFQNRDMLLFYK